MKLEYRAALAAAGLVSVIAGCGDEDFELGLVTAEWSIANRFDPNDCAVIGADLFEVAFFDLDGFFITEVEADCRDFVVSFDLEEDTYEVSTRLINTLQQEVADTLIFDNVVVESGVEVVLHADFPDPTIE